MSAKKSTKVPVEESSDSGYLSHELSSAPVSEEIRPEDVSGPVSSTLSSPRPSTQSSTPTQKVEYDSGVISEYIPEDLSGDSTQLEDTVLAELEEDLKKCDISTKVPDVSFSPGDSTQLEDTVLAELEEDLKKCDISTKVPDVSFSPAPIPEHLIPITKVFQQDADGDTVVHITAVHGCKMRTALLIRLCPHPSWLDITNDYGHTALHLAVMSGHPIIARMLVKAGASIAIRDHMGETALHTAVKSGKRDCLLALLDPIPGLPSVRDTVLNQTNYHGQACVHIAARMNNVDMLQTLALYGADINVKDGCAGWTPLHVAARAGNERVSRYLLELRSPRVHKYARDYAGRTPLRLARRTAVHSYYLNMYNHEDDETDTETEDDGEEFMETHSSFPVAVSTYVN